MTTAPQHNEKPQQPWLAYKRAMVVVAHPDDAEFAFGGTLAKLVTEGMELAYVICTNGDKGSSDPEMTSSRLAIIREREQRDARAREQQQRRDQAEPEGVRVLVPARPLQPVAVLPRALIAVGAAGGAWKSSGDRGTSSTQLSTPSSSPMKTVNRMTISIPPYSAAAGAVLPVASSPSASAHGSSGAGAPRRALIARLIANNRKPSPMA